jgi:hypothetical protein
MDRPHVESGAGVLASERGLHEPHVEPLPGMKLLQRLVDRIIARAMRDPYFDIVGTDGSTYMRRFWLMRPRKWLPISIRVHHILRSDAA